MSILNRKDSKGDAASKDNEAEAAIPVFRLMLDEDSKAVADNNVLLIPELGIRSSDSQVGNKLRYLVGLYTGTRYTEVIREVQRWCVMFSPNLGMVKLCIASHMHIWMNNHKVPSETEQKRMKMAFYATARRNPILDSYYEFLCAVAQQIRPSRSSRDLAILVERYSGMTGSGFGSRSEFSDILGGWYRVLADPSLVRLQDSDRQLIGRLGINAPACGDNSWMDELAEEFRQANYQTCIDRISGVVSQKKVVSQSLVRLCIASHILLWYGYGEVPHPSVVEDILRCCDLIGAEGGRRPFIREILDYSDYYDDPVHKRDFLNRIFENAEHL